MVEQHDQPAHSVARLGVGRYRVTLTKPFSGMPYPVCTVNMIGRGAYVATVSEFTSNTGVSMQGYGPNWEGFDVSIMSVDSNGGWYFTDAGFNFTVIGAN